MLVKHDISIKVAVAIDRRICKYVHLHSSALAVSTSSKVCIVCSARILGLAGNSVTRDAAAAEIVILKISRKFGEAKQIQCVVISIIQVEKLRNGSVSQNCVRRDVAGSRISRPRIQLET